MREDFEAQRKELNLAQSELSEVTSLRTFGAVLSGASSVRAGNNDKYGIENLNVRGKSYQSSLGEHAKWVDIEFPLTLRLKKLQLCTANPPQAVELMLNGE